MIDIQYHIFSDYKDEWCDTLREARALFNEWAKAYGCARLYAETYENGEIASEDCLLSVGSYPW